MGSCFKRCFGYFNSAMSISVGFHHRHNFGIADHCLEMADIVTHRF
jgi:hypothetical protein